MASRIINRSPDVVQRLRTDIAGQKRHSLTAVRPVGLAPGQRAWWLFLCDCGKEIEASRDHFMQGNKKSCGCRRRRYTLAGDRELKKYMPEYNIWHCMRRRCYSPADKRYADYGGRGIRVYSRWLNSFEAFLADVGRRPGPEYTIDRIDNDGNYEPGNVRWATRAVQSANRRNNIRVTIGNRTHVAYRWLRLFRISPATYESRIKAGWEPFDAIIQPIIQERSRHDQLVAYHADRKVKGLPSPSGRRRKSVDQPGGGIPENV